MSKILIDRSVVEQALEALDALTDRVDGTGFANTDEFDRALDSIDALRAALEHPQVAQKPIAWANINKQGDITHTGNKKTSWAKTPIYTHPQPKRQPLTDAQINDHRLALAYDSEDLPDPWDFKQGVRAAERAHGIGGEK